MITLARRETESGDVRVLMCRSTGSVFYYHGYSCQSEADHNGISMAPYIHAIYDILVQLQARDILMIGCGGGTLATMLARSGRAVVVVDNDPYAITIARRYFALPFEVTCHVTDGRTFMEQNKRKFDAIVVDAFTGDLTPDHLCSSKFFRLARRRLNAGGSVLVNAPVEHDLDLHSDCIAHRLGTSGFQTLILDTPGRVCRNAVVIGGKFDQLKAPSISFIPAVEAKELVQEVQRMRYREARRQR